MPMDWKWQQKSPGSKSRGVPLEEIVEDTWLTDHNIYTNANTDKTLYATKLYLQGCISWYDYQATAFNRNKDQADRCWNEIAQDDLSTYNNEHRTRTLDE